MLSPRPRFRPELAKSARPIRQRAPQARLPDDSYTELVTMLIDGRIPIAVMALTIVAVVVLDQIKEWDSWTLALACGILVLLALRALVVTLFVNRSRAHAFPVGLVQDWEVRYVRVILPYVTLLGLFNFHLAITGGEGVRLLVAVDTFGFCAATVSRGFVRPQLCALMVLIGALPTAVGFLFMAAASEGVAAVAFATVGGLTTIYAVSSLETVRHLYRAMLAQLATKRELAAFARVDPLTGLANRLAMRETLAREIAHDCESASLALLMIDLDGFKAVNDRLGHPIGDRLLCEIGRRLGRIVREGDLAVRLGGDEFCVIQTGIASSSTAEALANRIIKTLAEPFLCDGDSVQVGSSIGVALDDGSIADIDDLMERADSALYRAKRQGGNTLRFWRSTAKLTLAA
ncbi:GGDEF domain-containing protein [Sphingomonas sp.]|uniref:GGDEF domain-containing protein n=1 Tax=Sphingomonas sp. TaxID=28214 RepID=UPI0025E1DE60|nr:GGDEF domain-containing protein [Sphingomonas sp.]